MLRLYSATCIFSTLLASLQQGLINLFAGTVPGISTVKPPLSKALLSKAQLPEVGYFLRGMIPTCKFLCADRTLVSKSLNTNDLRSWSQIQPLCFLNLSYLYWSMAFS